MHQAVPDRGRRHVHHRDVDADAHIPPSNDTSNHRAPITFGRRRQSPHVRSPRELCQPSRGREGTVSGASGATPLWAAAAAPRTAAQHRRDQTSPRPASSARTVASATRSGVLENGPVSCPRSSGRSRTPAGPGQPHPLPASASASPHAKPSSPPSPSRTRSSPPHPHAGHRGEHHDPTVPLRAHHVASSVSMPTCAV